METPLSQPVYQPNNPDDSVRHYLTRLALAEKGRVEDYSFILKEMAPPPDITGIAQPGSMKGLRVGIIGGGLAGLAAAFELRKLGLDITVYDALEDRVGGRVYTWYFDREKNLYAELGPMRMPVSHETLWHYLNLFKIDTRPFIQNNPNGFIYLQDVRVRNDPDGRNVMQAIYPKYDLAPWEQQVPWQRLLYHAYDAPLLRAGPNARSEILKVLPEYDPFTLFWDAVTNRRIQQYQGLSNGAISLLTNFAPLAGQNLANSYLDYVQEVYSADLSFLYEIPGGIAKLPVSFYQSFQAKNGLLAYGNLPAEALGEVHYRQGCPVGGIHLDSSGRVMLTFTSRKNSGPETATYDYVICAIPFSTLRTVDIRPLFSNLKMQAIREVNYINAQRTLILFNRRFWEEGGPQEQIFGGASITDLPISQIYYPSDHANRGKKNWSIPFQMDPYCHVDLQQENTRSLARESGVLLASYNFGQTASRLGNMAPELRFREIKENIEAVHGLPRGYLDPLAVSHKTVNWDDEPWFRGALCYYTPEQKRLFSYASALPEYEERVFFAGEHISAKHRWMQGALKSGMEAANQLALAAARRITDRY